MGWKEIKKGAKDFGKKTEAFGRDIRDSPVGKKATDIAEDVGKSVRDWWKSDNVQDELKAINDKFIEVRDDFVKSLKPAAKEEQEAGIKKFDEYEKISIEALNNAENEAIFEDKRASVFGELLKFSKGLPNAEKNSDDGVDVVFSGNAEFVPEIRALNEDSGLATSFDGQTNEDPVVGVSPFSVDEIV
jgi:hypothetical protein